MAKITKNVHQNKVSVSEAAKRMGVSPSYIRMGIRSGRLPFGTAVKMSSVWTYDIRRPAFEEYLSKGVTLNIKRTAV